MRHKNLSNPSLRDDRFQYPMVVCSGMSGLGKTRMFEEWPRLFGVAQIPKPWLGVFVAYGNGHSPQERCFEFCRSHARS
jgi:hypothetical protein